MPEKIWEVSEEESLGPAARPVVFIHGLWLHGESWKPWMDFFNKNGYASSAASWPGDGHNTGATRENPSSVAGYGVEEVADYITSEIAKLHEKPILIGHSFGGLLAQLLLGRDLAAAAIAIDPAPIQGVLVLPISALKAAFPVLKNPLNFGKAISLTEAEFRFAFTNARPANEAKELWAKYAVPAPARPIFQAATANLNPLAVTKVNTANATRGPLLLTAGSRGQHRAAGHGPQRVQALCEVAGGDRDQGVRAPRALAHDRRRLDRHRGGVPQLAEREADCERPAHRERSVALIERYVITNEHGLRISVLTLGAIIQSVEVPDRDGRIEDVVLGFDTPEEYVRNPAYLGAVVGRYANRIAGRAIHARRRGAPVDGQRRRELAPWWSLGIRPRAAGARPACSRPRGKGSRSRCAAPMAMKAIPGISTSRVTYTLSEDDRLIVDYEASTDRATPINLSQHTYWDLAGARGGDILGHELQIDAEQFTPVDEALIPTGESRPVEGTPFDFRAPTRDRCAHRWC